VAVEAGINTIQVLIKNKIYDKLNALGNELESGIVQVINQSGTKAKLHRIGSLFTLFFSDKGGINNYTDVSACDLTAFARFFRAMLKQGVYLAPSQFEANFISVKHSSADIKKTIKAAEYALRNIK